MMSRTVPSLDKPFPQVERPPLPLSAHAPDLAPAVSPEAGPSSSSPPATPPEGMVSVPLATIQALLTRLEKLEARGTVPDHGTITADQVASIPSLPRVQPNRDPDNPADPNPCTCEDCTPFKVYHWFCTHCRKGPFRFEANTPGRGPVLRPRFQRQLQRYRILGHARTPQGTAEPIQAWVYWARYACSPACAALEQSQVVSEQWDLAQQRPHRARAIAAAVPDLGEHEAISAGDDLS